MEKYGFIYIWFDRKHKMYYIGCHWGNIDDGYICSSNRMRNAYRRRPKDFRRRILTTNIERCELLDEEYKWLAKIDDNELGTKYYNLRKHKYEHWAQDYEKRKIIGEKISKIQTGKKQSEDAVRNRFESRRGYKSSDETKLKLSLALKNHQKGMTGKQHSDETRKKIADRIKLWHSGRKSL